MRCLGLIFLICGGAFWLFRPNLYYGLPFLYFEDEGHHFNRTVEMYKTGDYNPHYFHKPSLHFYLRQPAVAVAVNILKARGEIQSADDIRTKDHFGLAGWAFTSSHPLVVVATRAVSLGLSLALIALTFWLCYLISQSASLSTLSAAILILSPEFFTNSTVVGVDVLMAVMVLAATISALYYIKLRRLVFLVLTAILSGLAISSKYSAAPVLIIAPLLVFFYETRNLKAWALALMIPLLSFMCGSPYILADLGLAHEQVSYEVWHYAVSGHEGHSAAPGLGQFLFYLNWFTNSDLGPVVLAFAILGSLTLCSRPNRPIVVFFAFPLLYISMMLCLKTNFTRNMVVVLPYASIVAAIGALGVVKIFGTAPRRVFVFLGLSFCISVIPLGRTLAERSVRLITHDARLDASRWLRENLPPEEDIAVQGTLQLPPEIGKLPGVTRFKGESLDPAELYARGFDGLVIGPDWPNDPKWSALVLPVKTFLGNSNLDRIPRDPEVRVLKVKPTTSDPETLVLRFDAERNAFIPVCAATVAKIGKGENYCWFSRRHGRLSFENWPETSKMLAGKMHGLKAEIMTPWDGQQAQFGETIWNPAAHGNWEDLNIPMMSDVDVTIRQIHSPLTRGGSSDPRRLGVALRAVKVSTEARDLVP